MKKKVLIVISAVVALLVVSLVLFVQLLGPTRGERISDYPHPRKALLVIDMQEDYLGTTARPPFPYKNATGLIATVNSLIHTAKNRNYKVVFIRQEFEGPVGTLLAKTISNGSALKGSPGTRVDARISRVADTSFGKPKGDSFSNSRFEKYCRDNSINELVLCGLDGQFCILHTAIGAVNRGYHVSIVTDAVAFRNGNKKQTVITKFNKHGCILLTANQFLLPEPFADKELHRLKDFAIQTSATPSRTYGRRQNYSRGPLRQFVVVHKAPRA